MKILPKFLKLTLTLLLFLACISDEELNVIRSKSMSFSELFQMVSSMSFQLSNDQIVYINYEYVAKNRNVIFLNLEAKEPDFFLLGNPADVKNRILNNSYEIAFACDKKTKNDVLRRSSIYKDQEKLISSFKKQIEKTNKNKLSIVYTPQNRSFYLNK
ncbi:hypothetical protein SAMN04489761_2197 [Tenacibaculum sp. MAR_2009_124]|uniref:hypothetical protein n=1 Tax=Tenacibaculum sp. MAR_2009_124 TaxID=1250059 RepID=UPI000896196E|nr:hypothetical protein [Tenacibaculum sp. MAR_2009_124]SEB99573.1 hypothetical protein SAMN04489761_2197 [Tenacibaculum sp. MAR_2009_124]